MTAGTHYAVLGVSEDADAAQIKRAFRELAKRYHPDRNRGDASAQERMKAVNSAYEVLRNPAKRREYDRSLSSGGSAPEPDFSWRSYQQESNRQQEQQRQRDEERRRAQARAERERREREHEERQRREAEERRQAEINLRAEMMGWSFDQLMDFIVYQEREAETADQPSERFVAAMLAEWAREEVIRRYQLMQEEEERRQREAEAEERRQRAIREERERQRRVAQERREREARERRVRPPGSRPEPRSEGQRPSAAAADSDKEESDTERHSRLWQERVNEKGGFAAFQHGIWGLGTLLFFIALPLSIAGFIIDAPKLSAPPYGEFYWTTWEAIAACSVVWGAYFLMNLVLSVGGDDFENNLENPFGTFLFIVGGVFAIATTLFAITAVTG